MDVTQKLPLLAGLTPTQFMRRHWHKKPLLVRQALPGFKPLLTRAELFDLATQECVQSRLIVQTPQKAAGWQLKNGPFSARGFPALSKPGWTLLVQSVDRHVQSVHELLQKFRFVPDARLDDVMISFATVGGGVGPHFDSYDVFLLQASGQRRWKIGKQKDLSLQPDMPLKILQNFEAQEEFFLQAGDMLYLPPGYAHEGVSESNDCQTYSIGFRAPTRSELAGQLLQRLGEYCFDECEQRYYRDPNQEASATPAAIGGGLVEFAQQALADALKDPEALPCALGEHLTEPAADAWFESDVPAFELDGVERVALHRCTRMMYDEQRIFINGESYRARGADATLMRRLADQRFLLAPDLMKLSESAKELLAQWFEAGWVVL